MNNKLIYNTFILLGLFFLLSACKSAGLPKITEPSYSTFNHGTERGYKVKFQLKNDTAKPTAVVINKVKQNISEENKIGNTYQVNIIAQSQKILGFKANIVEKPNGIFFQTNSGEEVFEEVNFKLE
ncbi:MAG: hypothetical protein Q4G16_05240 [Cruoricaptor ignavus]|nr:hypothetical protein [Cruoricaptor ignavus]